MTAPVDPLALRALLENCTKAPLSLELAVGATISGDVIDDDSGETIASFASGADATFFVRVRRELPALLAELEGLRVMQQRVTEWALSQQANGRSMSLDVLESIVSDTARAEGR